MTKRKIIDDKECMKLLTTPNDSLHLTTLSGHDVLYYAIELGDNVVQYFLNPNNFGLKEDENYKAFTEGNLENIDVLPNLPIAVHRCSLNLRMNPLQRALKHNLNENTIFLLINSFSAVHKDTYHRTPCMYLGKYNGKEKKKILDLLVQFGADLRAKDVDNNTAIDYSSQDKSFLNYLLSVISSNEEMTKFLPAKSFAPPRDQINVEYFIDGENTFREMANLLNQAKKSIYITDWWLTPQLYLIRDGDEKNQEENRFDNILLKKASDDHVNIKIIIWENVESVEPLKSEDTQKYLNNLHENIQVLRHSSATIEGFTHHQKIIIIDDYIAFIGGLDICLHRWDTQLHPIEPLPIYIGKDYFNPFYVSNNDDLSKSTIDYMKLNARTKPRQPWHDITFRIDGVAALDVSKNFIQRWNFTLKKQQNKFSSFQLIDYHSNDDDHIPRYHTKNSFLCSNVQIVRSIGKWSLGYNIRERSVFNSIKNAIREAEHFVYIETQYFISVSENSSNVPDEDMISLADAIINRIRCAIRDKKPFKVIIILPMFPEGDPLNNILILRILFHQLKTIEKIETEIEKILRKTIYGPKDFFNVYSLASCGLIKNIPHMNQIYIHAKLLITDKTSICGSANLNMRSLCGDRDSEIAVVVPNSDFSHSLIYKLWKEHLGDRIYSTLSGNIIKDFDIWDKVARSNTRFINNYFGKSTPLGCLPNKSDFNEAVKSMRTAWKQANFRSQNAESFKKLQDVLDGFVVKFPRKWLIDDIMATDKFDKARLPSLLSPVTALHLIVNLPEVACITFVEYLVQ